MYESVSIQNFRGFEDLTVDGLTRVNLIAGHNSVGKTALLEALLLLGHADQNSLLLANQMRGIPLDGPDDETISARLDSLFFNFQRELRVVMAGTHTDGASDSFELIVGPGALPSNNDGPTEIPSLPNTMLPTAALPLALAWGFGDQNIVMRYAEFGKFPNHPLDSWSEIEWGRTHDDRIACFVPRPGEASPIAKRWYEGVVQSRAKKNLVQVLKMLDGRVQDVDLLPGTSEFGLTVDIGLPRVVPIGLQGDGLFCLALLAMGANRARNGVLLVDEIDHGLHYSILKNVWSFVATGARDLNLQVFATTHSYECMTAAYEAFADHPEDFSMHRLERSKDGGIVCKSFGHEMLGVALDRGFEVR